MLRIDEEDTKVMMLEPNTPGFKQPFYHQEFNHNLEEGKSIFLSEINDENCPIRPTAFIFHSGRTGSTLVSSMLGELNQMIVFKEPSVLGSAFYRTDPDEQRLIKDLKRLINLFGQSVYDHCDRFIIKWTSWTALHVHTVRKAFPEVPILFVYRNPNEILASAQTKPAAWFRTIKQAYSSNMVDGIQRAKVDYAFKNIFSDAPTPLSVLQAYGYLLKHMFDTFAEVKDNIYIVNYNSTPHSIVRSIIPSLNLVAGDDELDRIREAGKFHAHSRISKKQQFIHDGERKDRITGTGIKKFVDEVVVQSMEQMEYAHEGHIFKE